MESCGRTWCGIMRWNEFREQPTTARHGERMSPPHGGLIRSLSGRCSREPWLVSSHGRRLTCRPARVGGAVSGGGA